MVQVVKARLLAMQMKKTNFVVLVQSGSPSKLNLLQVTNALCENLIMAIKHVKIFNKNGALLVCVLYMVIYLLCGGPNVQTCCFP